MIPVLNIIQGITDKLNKASNLEGQYFPNETLMLFANRAQTKLILKKIGLNNNYQLGLDAFRKRIKDLEVLITPYNEYSITDNDDYLNSFSTTQPTDLFLPIDMYVTATKGNCKDRVLQIIEIVKHGDLQEKLKSPHYTPHFNYQETIAELTDNKIYLYTDKKKSFTYNKLYLSYLRTPKQIDIVGYTHLDGTTSTNQDCELVSYLEEELLNLIVEELAMDTGNQELANNTLNKERTDE